MHGNFLAAHYKEDVDLIMRHATNAEQNVLKMIHYAMNNKDPRKIAEDVKCPYEHVRTYMAKIMRSLVWYCNPDSLNDAKRKSYLENLSASCKSNGFAATPEQLGAIDWKVWNFRPQ